MGLGEEDQRVYLVSFSSHHIQGPNSQHALLPVTLTLATWLTEPASFLRCKATPLSTLVTLEGGHHVQPMHLKCEAST